MNQQAIEMSSGDFADWAESAFSVDYDDVCMWDMLRDMDKVPQSGLLSEQPAQRTIPAELRAILSARKEYRSTVPAQFRPTRGYTEWDARGSEDGE